MPHLLAGNYHGKLEITVLVRQRLQQHGPRYDYVEQSLPSALATQRRTLTLDSHSSKLNFYCADVLSYRNVRVNSLYQLKLISYDLTHSMPLCKMTSSTKFIFILIFLLIGFLVYLSNIFISSY